MYQISGGGVTFSGGEPLIAPGICGLLKKFKELGVDTAIETAGLVKSDILTEAAKYTDHFMYDIKSLQDSSCRLLYYERESFFYLVISIR